MDNLERKHEHDYSNDANLRNFLCDSFAQISQGKQSKHEDDYDWRAIITLLLIWEKATEAWEKQTANSKSN